MPTSLLSPSSSLLRAAQFYHTRTRFSPRHQTPLAQQAPCRRCPAFLRPSNTCACRLDNRQAGVLSGARACVAEEQEPGEPQRTCRAAAASAAHWCLRRVRQTGPAAWARRLRRRSARSRARAGGGPLQNHRRQSSGMRSHSAGRSTTSHARTPYPRQTRTRRAAARRAARHAAPWRVLSRAWTGAGAGFVSSRRAPETRARGGGGKACGAGTGPAL